MDQAAASQSAQIEAPADPDAALAAARKRLFDPRSAEFVQDPYATYAVLREREPLSFRPKAQLLRYDTSVQVTDRRALEPLEIGGQRIEAGQTVSCVLGAANRDPAIYTAPDRLVLTRSGTKPVAFGGGIHFCLGAQLARLEGQIALAALLSRLPELSLPDLAQPDFGSNVFLRGLETLPARYPRKLDTRLDVAALARPAVVNAAPTRPAARVAAGGGCPFHRAS